jgi:hypothetical protein
MHTWLEVMAYLAPGNDGGNRLTKPGLGRLRVETIPMEEVNMKRKVAAILASGALVIATTAPAFASPSPPTNGGNGAGQSGQCTGPQDDRPASCKSQGGPGDPTP